MVTEGYSQNAWACVLQVEVLIGELLAIDGLATSAVSTGEVTTLWSHRKYLTRCLRMLTDTENPVAMT